MCVCVCDPLPPRLDFFGSESTSAPPSGDTAIVLPGLDWAAGNGVFPTNPQASLAKPSRATGERPLHIVGWSGESLESLRKAGSVVSLLAPDPTDPSVFSPAARDHTKGPSNRDLVSSLLTSEAEVEEEGGVSANDLMSFLSDDSLDDGAHAHRVRASGRGALCFFTLCV